MKEKFESKQEYINAIAEAAQKACKRYGYLPSVLIAQSCLQNGFGIPAYWDNPEIKYLLKYNNMVGQKAELLTKTWYDKSVWPGKSFNKRTPEVYGGTPTVINDNFRIFDSIEQSFCDFILFLLYASNQGYNGKPKYGKEVVNIKDPATLIKEVGGRGYATGPTYPKNVMRIINENNLTKYDDLSKIEPSNYIPEALKKQYGIITSQKEEKEIIDITAANRSQVRASRGNNPIEWIVIHYLGVPNADNPNLYGGGYGGHYNIKRDGTIYKAADPKTAVVLHCGGGLQGSGPHPYYQICTNYNSIGIENSVCYTDPNQKSPSADSDKWYFTTETQQSLVYLVSKLMDEYNIDINHVIRHYDVNAKTCPNPYVKNNKLKTSWTWDEFKSKLMSYRGQAPIQKEVKNVSNTQDIIEKATQYMINIANNNSHGYDQAYRWGERGDYDCSSLVISAWQQAGVPVKSNGATYTGNMYNIFLKCGFKDVTSSVNLNNGSGLQRGDVLLNNVHHTAMYIGNGQECEASVNEKGKATGGQPGDQTGQEIKIRSYRNYPWNAILRYTGGTIINIISSELSKGSKGAAVKQMQTMLIKCGYSCGKHAIDGDFGKATLTALKKFQKDNGLVVDGIYGTNTKAKLTEKYNAINTPKATPTTKKSIEQIAKEVIANKWGIGEDRKNKLIAAGYDYNTVQNKVNQLLKPKDTDYAESYDKSIAKTYTTKCKLNLRKGPSKEKTVITIIPKGGKVVCYGYHTNNWYYVQYNNIVGFCDKTYLQ